MIPAKYSWLNKIGLLPRMVTNALNYYGTKEIPGKGKSNPVIMDMAARLGIPASIVPDDDTPWCAVFMAYIAVVSDKPMEFKGYDLVRASAWGRWGIPVPKSQAKLGDILVFSRAGGNHVGLYIAESATSFFVYGGNQSNMVGFTEIAKNRLSHVRRYYAHGAPVSAKKYYMDSSGKMSVNEK